MECTASIFRVEVKWKWQLPSKFGYLYQSAWHCIPENCNLRSFCPPNKNVAQVCLECCDQDITDERMVLGCGYPVHWSNIFVTGSTSEVSFPVCCSWAHNFFHPVWSWFFNNAVFAAKINVLFKIVGHIKYQTKKMDGTPKINCGMYYNRLRP